MTNVQSKLVPVYATCKEYVHPWTDSCWNSTAGLMLQASQHSVRIYTAVYLLSLLMRGRIPTLRDLKRTILGILQSSAFLTTNGFSFVMFTCLLRNLFGKFYFITVSFIPSFLASLVAIFIERPTRRPLLALYVANVATETIWRMIVSRGYVKSIPHGQAFIFGLSSSILLYFYRLGLHSIYKDSLFDIIRFVVGRNEEGSNMMMVRPLEDEDDLLDQNDGIGRVNGDNDGGGDDGGGGGGDGNNNNNNPIQPQQQENQPQLQQQQSPDSVQPSAASPESIRISTRNNYTSISYAVQVYMKLIQKLKTQPKHRTCPHNNSCIYYSLRGGLKLFSVGLGLQVTLKLALQLPRILKFRLKLRKILFNRDTLKLGVFLGGFSFLYKIISCSLRHISGFDHAAHAIPAGFLASIAFTQYPDTTIALYLMWKMLQITYNIGIQKNIVPQVPGFTIFLYCFSTAMLFYAATFEPLNLRSSYWKFLSSLSGRRVCEMDRRPFDVFGLESSKQAQEVMKLTHTAIGPIKFAFI